MPLPVSLGSHMASRTKPQGDCFASSYMGVVLDARAAMVVTMSASTSSAFHRIRRGVERGEVVVERGEVRQLRRLVRTAQAAGIDCRLVVLDGKSTPYGEDGPQAAGTVAEARPTERQDVGGDV